MTSRERTFNQLLKEKKKKKNVFRLILEYFLLGAGLITLLTLGIIISLLTIGSLWN